MTHSDAAARPTHVRYLVLFLLFLVTTISYADRAAMGIAGPSISKALGLTPIDMGYILSGFALSYVIAQLPSGVLLDRFGARRVYITGIVLWSLSTMLHGTAGFFAGASAVAVLYSVRLLVGVFEAPCFPGNARIVANWFPSSERGTASAIFNSAQYFALVAFNPLMSWLAHSFDWPWLFYVMGGMGIGSALLVAWLVKSPRAHPMINKAEYDLIEKGGALVNLEERETQKGVAFTWANIRPLVTNRMLVGIYLAQYCISTLTYFFATWFPIYLVQARHMTIMQAGIWTALPAICGFAGGVLGGVASDAILRRTGSLTVARKTPIFIGMILAMVIVACNFTQSQTLVVTFMSIAFFGKGIASLGWPVIADTSPRHLFGLTASIFNTIGNTSGIIMPILVGYIVGMSGSFDGALIFIAAHCVLTILLYFLVVPKIERLELPGAA